MAGIDGKGRKYYETEDFPGQPWRVHDLTKQTTASERPNSFFTIRNPQNGKEYPANPKRTWCITQDTFDSYYAQKRIVFPGDYDFLKISPCSAIGKTMICKRLVTASDNMPSALIFHPISA